MIWEQNGLVETPNLRGIIGKWLRKRSYIPRNFLIKKTRGDYDYCQVPGTRQLSPLEVGEDNSKFEPKKIKKKFNFINIVKHKVVVGVLRHAESKSGLYFVLTLLLHMILTTFKSKHMMVLAGFL